MRKTFGALAILIFVLFIYGCGGGGDSGSEDISASTLIPLKTNTIRTAQAGDTWNYSVTGTYTANSTTVNLSGTGNETILSSPKQDPITLTNCLDYHLMISLSGPSGFSASIIGHTYILQDATGTEYEYGLNDGFNDMWVSEASGGYFVSSQSPVIANQSYGASVTYSDGSTETTSAQIVGIENVNTPAGYYEAYKVFVNATYIFTDGTRTVESDTFWSVPGLGTVKETLNITYYTGSTVTANLKLSMSMTNTSVTY